MGQLHSYHFKHLALIVKWDAKKADKKVERLRKIVKEAAEQSHRSEIPEVHAPASFKQLLSMSHEYDVLPCCLRRGSETRREI